ncbi:class I SAM-dependent methyltransferase [Umezawaea endophytica]|uniref:Class I SAM-dependent methyltransferase n=1 Tax=Umezawaea endophytica TaxID=1654476 RepID=A0A9X3AG04_9PSEU|nr:class I SAM-dependent methyltransferase [Umezawaea endophytica]MCS7477855.1 class I SAM-dependent methyltransferase [Umezawaea endophytica]
MAQWFGLEAARYDRARPTYPQALIDRITTLSPGKRFVDVGCGTGISSRPFQAAGCTVLGVEPDGRMADFARGRGLDVEVAKFEDWDPAGRTFDAVISGTAWHWVDPLAGARKVADVLSPHGLLALFDNGFDLPPAVMAAQAEAYRHAVPEARFPEPSEEDGEEDGEEYARQIYAQQYVKAADGILRTGAFGEPEELRFAWERTYTRDEWLDILPTQGGLNHLREDQRERFLTYVGTAIDELGGVFTIKYATVGIAAIKR